MATSTPVTWLLTDDRIGNINQCLGVAGKLEWPIIRKDLRYNALAALPSWLWRSGLQSLTPQSRTALTPPWPDLIIAAGRRTAPIARYIKQYAGSHCRWVQLMWPGEPANDIDLIAVPQHDQQRSRPNMMETMGAPHHITPEKLQHAGQLWRPKLAGYTQAPVIALLVGGSVKGHDFTPTHATLLGQDVARCAQSLGASLLVTTSRRTSDSAEAALTRQLPLHSYIHNWRNSGQGGDSNPYFAFLALADIIIVTGDSMSMCSEACATGKPVYIYSPADITQKKHGRLHRTLVEQGLARMLTPDTIFSSWSYTPLDEAGRIAEQVKIWYK